MTSEQTWTETIQPLHNWSLLRFDELWRYRELLFFLIWRDISVRYKQTLLGAAWAVIQPLATMIVFSIFFGNLAKIPSDNVPYPIFAYSGLLPWSFFAGGLAASADSLISNSNLVSKVYFPRILIPLGAVMSGLIDFLIAFIILIGLILYFRVTPTLNILMLPLFLLLAIISALGLGLWLSALNVQYRDIRYVVPFFVQFLLFATPVAYPSSLLAEPWRTLYGLNPMAGVVEGFRWALIGTPAPGGIIWVSAGAAVLLLLTGLAYFRAMEDNFADVI
jgi:lipopolysaccharide transport system permease protein